MGFVGNLVLFAAMNKFCKSIKSWWSYSQGLAPSFESQCIMNPDLY